VQHVLLRRCVELKGLLGGDSDAAERRLHVMICGDADGMARAVMDALNEMFGASFVDVARKAGRLQLDVWTPST
jgi:sulfite reductase alpha subunit-like flavoprotein